MNVPQIQLAYKKTCWDETDIRRSFRDCLPWPKIDVLLLNLGFGLLVILTLLHVDVVSEKEFRLHWTTGGNFLLDQKMHILFFGPSFCVWYVDVTGPSPINCKINTSLSHCQDKLTPSRQGSPSVDHHAYYAARAILCYWDMRRFSGFSGTIRATAKVMS